MRRIFTTTTSGLRVLTEYKLFDGVPARVLGVLVACWLMIAPVSATTADGGSNAADFLRLNAGAAAAAQGEAYAARSGGVEAFPYNPAGIRGAEGNEILFQHNSYVSDVTSEYLAYLYTGQKISMAASISYLNEGNQTRRTISNPTGLGDFSANAIIGAIGVAVPVREHFVVGATAKMFEEKIDDASRSGAAFDVGAQWQSASRRFALGAVVRNLGATVKFDRDRENLATEYALGASVLVHERIRLSGEVAFPTRQAPDYKAGIDVILHPMLSLRAGYNSRNDLGSGLSAGAGFRYHNFLLDYAWVGFGVAGDAHRIALTVKF